MDDIEVPPENPEGQTDDFRSRAELLERKLDELKRQSDIRLIRAEMKVEAIRAGMIDLDGLKLLDLTDVKLDDDGAVPDAAERITRLKRSKPWLFGTSSSSSALTPPSAQPPRQKHASEMTNAEYAAARSALLRHRY